MRAKIGALYICQVVVVVTIFLSLAAIFSTIGCGTGSLLSYRNSIQNANEPKVNMLEWRFDLLNSKYQKMEKESWEDDGPG